MLIGQPSQRSVYSDAVWRMRLMLSIPGGKAVVTRIVAELREAYPRRRALMEELDRLGLPADEPK